MDSIIWNFYTVISEITNLFEAFSIQYLDFKDKNIRRRFVSQKHVSNKQ